VASTRDARGGGGDALATAKNGIVIVVVAAAAYAVWEVYKIFRGVGDVVGDTVDAIVDLVRSVEQSIKALLHGLNPAGWFSGESCSIRSDFEKALRPENRPSQRKADWTSTFGPYVGVSAATYMMADLLKHYPGQVVAMLVTAGWKGTDFKIVADSLRSSRGGAGFNKAMRLCFGMDGVQAHNFVSNYSYQLRRLANLT